MALPRILVVEDDKSIMMLEQRILEDAGYSVDCAVSGDQALEMARANRYAVIVADVMMPGMDGIDLTKEIFKIYQRSVPVLLVTAMHDALKTAHTRDAKPMSTLQKPFTPQALLTAVRLLEAQSKSGGGPSKPQTSPSRNKPGASAKSPLAKKAAPQPNPSNRKKSWLEKLLHPSDKG
jgi:DNA-binding response OmpR family regulator